MKPQGHYALGGWSCRVICAGNGLGCEHGITHLERLKSSGILTKNHCLAVKAGAQSDCANEKACCICMQQAYQ